MVHIMKSIVLYKILLTVSMPGLYQGVILKIQELDSQVTMGLYQINGATKMKMDRILLASEIISFLSYVKKILPPGMWQELKLIQLMIVTSH